jgi:hypothetical protein
VRILFFNQRNPKLIPKAGKIFQFIQLFTATFMKEFLQKESKSFCDFILTNSKQDEDRYLEYLMTCFIRYGLKFGRVYVTLNYQQNEEKILGISIFQHPYTSSGICFQKLIRVGMGYSIFNMKWNHISNVSNLIQKQENFHKKILDQKDVPHWTLLFVGTNQQSKGIGSDLLFPIFKAADEMDLPIFTSLFYPNQQFEKFFKNNGFDFIEKANSNGKDPEISFMIRKPK